MAVKNKPVLGYRGCPDCGKRGTIHQGAGQWRRLYQRNCDCKYLSSDGKMAQSRFWYETEWLPGLKPEIPPANIYSQEEYRAELASLVDRNTRISTWQGDLGDLEELPPAGSEPDVTGTNLEPTETDLATDQDTDWQDEQEEVAAAGDDSPRKPRKIWGYVLGGLGVLAGGLAYLARNRG